MPRVARAAGSGQGPAKGPGSDKPRAKPLDTASDKQRERGQKLQQMRWGSLKEKMAAYAAVNPETKVTERAPNRVEIAELARSGMPDALKRLELLIHTSRSDMAIVNAFNSLKELSYGKDPQSIDMRLDFENMSEDELRTAILAEIGAADAEGSGDDGGASSA